MSTISEITGSTTPNYDSLNTPTSETPIQNTMHKLTTDNLKLPFETPYQEYEKFISNEVLNKSPIKETNESNVTTSPHTPQQQKMDEINNFNDPNKFLKHIDNIKHLENRLNYRFLELEAKLRFLRLLTAGTDISSSDLTSVDIDSEQLQNKLNSLLTQVEELKKIGKTLRKKIGKCFHQAEVRRCIEGKHVLQDEIDMMTEEIRNYQTFFQSNGLNNNFNNDNNNDVIEWAKSLESEKILGGEEFLENNLLKLSEEIEELGKSLTDIEKTFSNVNEEEEQLDEEIIELEREKERLENQYKELSSHEMTEADVKLINEQKVLKQLVSIWESF